MSRRPAAFGVMLASGFAGLGYQIIWTQQSALWLGHEAAAVLAVVTAFFGGLAVGALLLGARIERSARPALWYAGCEVVIACWSLVLAHTMAPAGFALAALAGPEPGPVWQGAIAFGGSFLLLLPATAAMGATLPAMARMLAKTGPVFARSPIGALYAANTLGAVLGVLASAFWLVPTIGLAASAWLCAALNIACAVGALVLTRGSGPVPVPMPVPAPVPVVSARPTRAPARRVRLLALLAGTGLLGIGYEVLVVRVVSQLAENTVYTFAVLLAVYLVGTAGGAAWQARSVRRQPARVDPRPGARVDPLFEQLSEPSSEPPIGHLSEPSSDRLTRRLLLALALACGLGVAALWAGPAIRDAVLAWPVERSMLLGIGAEAVLALAAFALPTVLMGALFSHLCTQAQERGIGFGLALGANTLGAAAAPWLFGVALLPALGAMGALVGVVAGYAACALPQDRRPDRNVRDGKGHDRRAAWLRPAWLGAVAVAGAAALFWLPPLRFVDVPVGGRLLAYTEGPTAAVSVVESADGVRVLRIDNRQQEGSSATAFVDARQALLPMLLHPAPRRALFLGLGTGVTASAAAADPTLQVDVAELLPEVVEAASWFRPGSAASASAPASAAASAPSRLHAVVTDARRYVRLPGPAYDLIVADNFHPARSGSAALYTVEHFAAVRARLAPGGVFCQWLPLHQLELSSLRHIVRSFVTVYPDGFAMLANNGLLTPVIGLVARPDAPQVDPAALRARLASNALPQALEAYGIVDALSLLGGVIAGPTALQRFAGDAVANTDDRPIVAYLAPRAAYAATEDPADRLLALIAELSVTPQEIVQPDRTPFADAVEAAVADRWSQRLAAYWQARDAFLAAGRTVRPVRDVRAMLAQVQAPLLAALRTSPDFHPAYDPLLRMARALAAVDPQAARELLHELHRLQPQRPEAAEAGARLSGGAREGARPPA